MDKNTIKVRVRETGKPVIVADVPRNPDGPTDVGYVMKHISQYYGPKPQHYEGMGLMLEGQEAKGSTLVPNLDEAEIIVAVPVVGGNL